TLEGDQLHTTIVSVNAEVGRAHAQNIYGAEGGGDLSCPTSDSDQLLLALTDEAGDYPTTTGNLTTFERTYTLGEGGTISADDLGPLDERVVTFHGMSVDGE